MKLSELLSGVEYKLSDVSGTAEIKSVVSDSRNARNNSLFLCIHGTKRNGEEYAAEAVENGAAVCVAEKEIAGFPCVVVPDVRRTASFIYKNFYNDPAGEMRLFGITGTNGKTSTAEYLRSILSASGRKVGVIGTSGIFAGEEKIELPGSEIPDIPASMTTPDPGILFEALAIMKERGIRNVVIEVSSHAVYQKKVDSLDFFCGVFTNLSPEHLDLHGNMEEYFRVKKSFLDKCKIIVYNRDDPYGKRFYPMGNSFGMTDVKNVVYSCDSVQYDLCARGAKIRICAHSPGDFTVYNSMAAATCAMAAGIMPRHIEKGIETAEKVPGRMEKVFSEKEYGFSAIIDFAHTPAALKASLISLKKANAEKITILFGCGGDRDRTKRPIMGKTAAMYADRIIVTDDNPRNEDRMGIIEDILKGIPKGTNVEVIPSRRDAIAYAVKTAEAGEVLLLSGKGGEKYETVKGRKIPFDEKEILAEEIKKRTAIN